MLRGIGNKWQLGKLRESWQLHQLAFLIDMFTVIATQAKLLGLVAYRLDVVGLALQLTPPHETKLLDCELNKT